MSANGSPYSAKLRRLLDALTPDQQAVIATVALSFVPTIGDDLSGRKRRPYFTAAQWKARVAKGLEKERAADVCRLRTRRRVRH